MKKIGMLYFSDNELHCLEVGYGIAALQNSKYDLYVKKISDISKEQEEFYLKKEEVKIWIVFLSYGCFDLLKKICKDIKVEKKDVSIVVCHALANKFYRELLDQLSQIDVVVLGEYEETLVKLAEKIFKGQSIEECNGIAYRKNNEVCVNVPGELANIDTLSFPNRMFDYQGSNLFHMYGSRGCDGNCSFCDRNSIYSYEGRKCTRWRSVENIISEIDMLVKKHQCKFIYFSDPTFLPINEINERLDALYDYLMMKQYWIQFTFNIRAEQIDETVISRLIKLKKCGLGKVFIGIESFNETDLRLYGKRAGVQAVCKCIDILNRCTKLTDDYYLKVEYGFINFNPYSTEESLYNNIQSFRKLGLNLNPYTITTKLTVNSLTAITSKIDKDSLLKCNLENMSLSDKMQYRFEYDFANYGVEKIYNLLKKAFDIIAIQNDNGTEFLRNRYIHYYGHDSLMEKYDRVYSDWMKLVDHISYEMFQFVVCKYNDSNISREVEKEAEKYKKDYCTLERELKGIQQRVIIRLKKINELVYYRPIFR